MVNHYARDELRALTGLRFFAAFLVFLFHIEGRWSITSNEFLSRLLSQGAVGMSVFFMLSGFILAYSYEGRSFSTIEFYRNRFARIYPIYVVAALLSLPWLAVAIINGGNYLRGIAKGLALIFTSILMIQAWFPQLFGYWNNPAAWSLSAEAFFYCLFPFIISGFAPLPKRILLIFLSLTYSLAVLPGFVFAIFEPRPQFALQIFYGMPIFRLPEFVAGICIFLIARDIQAPRYLDFACLSLICSTIVYLAVFGDLLPLFVLHNWIVVPTIGLLLVCLGRGNGLLARIAGQRIFVWAGKISYCFYSFQFVVIFSMLYFRQFLPEDGLVICILAFIILISLSASGYHFIEAPMRKWIRLGMQSPVEKVVR